MYFTDLLDKYHIPYTTEGRYARTGWVNFQCCFCDGGTDPEKPYCGYNQASNYIYCWRCGWHPLDKTIMVLTNVDHKTAKDVLGKLEVDRDSFQTVERRGKVVLPEAGPLKKAHRQYLRGRGFDPNEIVSKWGVQGIGRSSRLSWRLLIPIHYRGEVVSWTTRKLGDRGSRYISASPEEEAINHKDLLYGADHCGHSTIVFEGPTGCWRFGYGTCATLGVQVRPAQVLRLSNFVIRAICFDPEPAAQKRAMQLVDQLSAFAGETHNIVLDSADPGVATKREIRLLRKEFLE
jgi:hypothetical protein